MQAVTLIQSSPVVVHYTGTATAQSLPMLLFFSVMLIVRAETVSTTSLIDCPDRPSCVSSCADDPRRRIEPLSYSEAPAKAMAVLAQIIRDLPRATVTQQTERHLRAIFTSRIFGFKDDVELVIRDGSVIDVRSMSRKGYYDFGVNRARVEHIRQLFERSGNGA